MLCGLVTLEVCSRHGTLMTLRSGRVLMVMVDDDTLLGLMMVSSLLLLLVPLLLNDSSVRREDGLEALAAEAAVGLVGSIKAVILTVEVEA